MMCTAEKEERGKVIGPSRNGVLGSGEDQKK